jgi:cytochrome c oxidase subunit 1
MHILGVGGHMRRIFDPTHYDFLRHLQPINQFITVSAFCLGLAQFVFLINFFYSLFWGPKAGRNPWNSNTLEWITPSPPPHGNFEAVPIVYHGPYEYGVPGVSEDHVMQTRKLEGELAGAVGHGH